MADNRGPTPGATNTAVTTQTPVTEVYGTPGDGKVVQWNATTGRLEWGAGSAASLPTQTGNAGKYLTTDGSNPSWAPVAGSIETVNTVAASGAAQTIPDVTTATMNRITLTANCTFTFPTAAAGKGFSILLTQDATGSRTATWPTVKWAAGVVPTLTTAATKSDELAFRCYDGTNWIGTVAGQNF